MALIAGVQYSGVPAGTIMPCGNGTPPPRTLLCDGSAVSKPIALGGVSDAYIALWNAIGSTFGATSTQFNLPDLRGRFLRGVDNMGTGAAGRDPDANTRTAMNTGGATGNAIGSVQDHVFVWHNHGGGDHRHWSDINYDGNNYDHGNAMSAVSWFGGGHRNTRYVSENNPAIDGPNVVVVGQGGNETRPLNAYVNYCIAY